MNKVKAGSNMYQWVTHTSNPIGGECPHRCLYCYAAAIERRFKGGRYWGDTRPVEEELKVKYGAGKTIFVGDMNDVFALGMPASWISDMLRHCRMYPANTYVFQTKNPSGYWPHMTEMPPNVILGATIETNRNTGAVSLAPQPHSRFCNMLGVRDSGHKTFVTVEPIMRFDLEVLLPWIIKLRPSWANVGADSGGHGLPEPTGDEVEALIAGIEAEGIEVRRKANLERLTGKVKLATDGAEGRGSGRAI